MGASRHEGVGRIDLFGGNGTADFGGAGRPGGRPAPGPGGHAAARNISGTRIRASAARAKGTGQSTRASPHGRVFEKRAAVCTPPKTSSIRLRCT